MVTTKGGYVLLGQFGFTASLVEGVSHFGVEVEMPNWTPEYFTESL